MAQKRHVVKKIEHPLTGYGCPSYQSWIFPWQSPRVNLEKHMKRWNVGKAHIINLIVNHNVGHGGSSV
jgi:hypothetical protein